MQRSGLHPFARRAARAAVSKPKVNVFHLILFTSFLRGVLNWTPEKMVRKGLRPVSSERFKSWLGLEMAASLNRFNNMESYWRTDMFTGNRDFRKVMGRARFKEVCSPVRPYPYYDHRQPAENPIQHSDTVVDHLAKNCASVVLRTGVKSLDENTVRCKGRTSAPPYIRSNPVKFGICFYVVAKWRNIFTHVIR